MFAVRKKNKSAFHVRSLGGYIKMVAWIKHDIGGDKFKSPRYDVVKEKINPKEDIHFGELKNSMQGRFNIN